MSRVLPVLLLFMFIGCSTLGIRSVNERKGIAQERIREFRSLLKNGWEIKTLKGKVILIRNLDNGLEVRDVFHVN